MANVFDADIATARELIDLYGVENGWRKAATPSEDSAPGYPTLDPDSEPVEPVPVKIAWFAPRDLGRGTEEFIAALVGTEVPVGSEIGLMAGDVPFSPEITDSIVREDTREIGITKIDRLAPNGLPVLYYVTVSL